MKTNQKLPTTGGPSFFSLIRLSLFPNSLSAALLILLIAVPLRISPAGGVPDKAPHPVKDNPMKSRSTSPIRDSIVKSALSLVGTPYRYGSNSKKGFDCCGFVMYVYARNHISVPRTSREQYEKARKISFSDIRKGDLLFYKINSKKISHVGIYIGNGQFVHSSVPGSCVRVERIDQEYWQKYFAGAASFL